MRECPSPRNRGYKTFAMRSGRKTFKNKRQPRRAAPLSSRPAHRDSSLRRPTPSVSQNAQRNYERYLTLARAEAQTGNMVGAETYYQHAEHFYKLMYSDPDSL